MFRWLGKAWNNFRAYNKDRLIMSLMSNDGERHKTAFDQMFEKGKRTSDFVGMIVRSGFALFAAQYFWQKYRSATEDFWRIVMMYCAVASTLLAISLIVSVVWIVTLYQAREVPTQRSMVGKWISLIVALGTTVMFYLGGYELIKEVAAAAAV